LLREVAPVDMDLVVQHTAAVAQVDIEQIQVLQ
jgi:hypothetical protein